MEKQVRNIMALALVVSMTSGCAMFNGSSPEEDKLASIQVACYTATSVGTTLALQQNADWRPQFEVAYQSLNQLVEQKIVNGAFVRQILASLPVKELKSETARVAIEGVTYLYDTTVGDRVNLEAAPYIMAATIGIRDGLKVALKL